MMLFDKTGRPAVAVLGIAVLAGLLPLGGCSDSTTGSTYGSGDKRDDPALKASMEKSMEIFKSKTARDKGNPTGQKRRSLSPSSPSERPLGERRPDVPPGRGWRYRGGGPMGLRFALRLQSDHGRRSPSQFVAALAGACAVVSRPERDPDRLWRSVSDDLRAGRLDRAEATMRRLVELRPATED